MNRWLEITRPFTLFPPLLGMVSGALSAWGSGRSRLEPTDAVMSVVLGAVMAALLNAASNVLNQICDLRIDRINRPDRVLPSGRMTIRSAQFLTLGLYAASLALAAAIQPAGSPELLVIVLLTAFLTWAYSAPPLRWRRIWWAAPLVIAIPRGGLLKVAGWATLAPVFSDSEPWCLAGIFFLFVLGVASIKDFADVEGDRADGVLSLPLRWGAERAARMIAPFYVLPWLLGFLMVVGPADSDPILSIPRAAGAWLFAGLAVLGAFAATNLVRRARELHERGPGAAAWRHLYWLMMVAQVGIAVLYFLRS